MAIFRRDAGDPPQASPPDSPPPSRPAPASGRSGSGATTLVAAGTRIVGEITGSANLNVEGQLEGTVRLDSDVTIAPGGRAQGEIAARSVRIGGKMVGNVGGSDLVELTASGSLEGNIAAARVIIAEGAFFKGQVEMQDTSRSGDAKRQENRGPAKGQQGGKG